MTPADFADAQAIEWDAGELFRGIGMEEIADHEPYDDDELAEYVAGGRAWVVDTSVKHSGTSVVEVGGYLVSSVVDGVGHIDQVSVRRRHRGQRLGVALLEHAERLALADGFDTVTLTTFRSVPWNAPYYARLGYSLLDSEEIGPELAAVMAHERDDLGLERWGRVAMRKALHPQV